MKRSSILICVLSMLHVLSVSSLIAQNSALDKIKEEIVEVSELEIHAFKIGDCQGLAKYIDDEVTLYLNGRKAPNKAMLLNFCNRIERPFEVPSLIDMEYFPIDEETAYVVRTMEFSKSDKVYKKEIVTVSRGIKK